MRIAQELYEGISLKGESTGLITYMRTDSTRVAEQAQQNCRALIKDRFGEKAVHAQIRAYKNKSTAQDAHEAIRPTDAFHTPESVEASLSKDQYRLYTLIWQRFVATQMIPARLETTTASIELGEAIFAASGSKVLEEGFLKAYPHVTIVSGEQIDSGYKSKDELEHDALKKSQHFTSPPSRFTEASLIKELEAQGIGRPSTYATIISTLRKRKYVGMEKKSFVPTPLGTDVNSFLVSKFDPIFNVKFTANMENELDGVEEGRTVWHTLVSGYYDELMKLVKSVDLKKEKASFTEATDIVCDKCQQGKLVVRRSKGGEFLSCNRFPACKNIKNFSRDKDGKIHIEEPAEPRMLDEKCPQCGSPLQEKRGRYGAFIACSNYPKCKFTRPITTGVKCPDCGQGELTQRRNKKGGTFFSCTRYPDCKFITNDKPLPIACPDCGNPFIYEKYSKALGEYKQCPKCKKTMA